MSCRLCFASAFKCFIGWVYTVHLVLTKYGPGKDLSDTLNRITSLEIVLILRFENGLGLREGYQNLLHC